MAKIVGEPKILPYDIIEVMEDPEFKKHFFRRFEMVCQGLENSKLQNSRKWYAVYKNCPEILYQDVIDEIKVVLKRQESSAALLPFYRTINQIVMPAVNDWVCEKEGRIPEREIIPDTIKLYPIPLEKYYANKKESESRGQN